MKTRLLLFWDWLTSNYWFVPTGMALIAVALSFATLETDRSFQGLSWAYSGGAEGARQLLATVAGSMITVAGVVFSITIVALTLASSQFGPRLLRNFLRDTGNQIVLGTFIATFLYCLLILRTVRGGDGSSMVPQVSITVAVLLAILSLGVLIYFIHHVSTSIQVVNVIASVDDELADAINRLFPEKLGREKLPEETTANDVPDFAEESCCTAQLEHRAFPSPHQ